MRNSLYRCILIILFFLLFTSNTLRVYGSETYLVNTERLNVREFPTKNSKAIGYLNYGTVIEVIERTESPWLKIKGKNFTGYVNEVYLQKKTITNNKKSIDNNTIVLICFILLIILIILLVNYLAKEQDKRSIPLHQVKSPDLQQKIVINRKSVGLAILLTLFFGPIGMFYSTIKGALIMIFSPFIALTIFIYSGGGETNLLSIILLQGLILYMFLYWLICIIWAAISANNSNKIIINTSHKLDYLK